MWNKILDVSSNAIMIVLMFYSFLSENPNDKKALTLIYGPVVAIYLKVCAIRGEQTERK